MMETLYELWTVEQQPDTDRHIATYDSLWQATSALSNIESSGEHEGAFILQTHRPTTEVYGLSYRSILSRWRYVTLGMFLGTLNAVLWYVLYRVLQRPTDRGT